MADEAKGNAAFSSGNYDAAINLAPTPTDPPPTPTRPSSSNPTGPKATASYHGQFDDAISAYQRGLQIDPSNAALKDGLKESLAAPQSNPFSDAFSGPQMWAKLTADPSTRAFMQQPDFVKMMPEIYQSQSLFERPEGYAGPM